jgi:phosphatidylserine decarboxylase
MSTSAKPIPSHSNRRLGGWLPAKEAALEAFRTKLAAQVKARPADAPLCQPVQDLAALINVDPVLRMYLDRAIHQAIHRQYNLGYTSIHQLMVSINEIMTYAPPFDETELVGCPLNALLDWPMCMPSGFAFFRTAEVNAKLQAVLQYWCKFLSGPDSRNFLNTTSPTGWFCPEAYQKIGMQQFVCDPSQPYWGFASWNDFFTRQFQPGERPIADPGNNKVIINACESTPYNIQENVKLYDAFWIKAQPYSLSDIFTRLFQPLAQSFVGGSVYQAFLSAYNYHRWNAPVSGVVSHAYVVGGTYYSDVESEGLDPAGPNDSQGYITAVATRAVIVIECADPTMGRVACVFVGMAEVSSCIIEVDVGQTVQKGDELGYFQYGGSTHCLIFQPGVIQSFVPQPPFDPNAPPLELNTQIATAN